MQISVDVSTTGIALVLPVHDSSLPSDFIGSSLGPIVEINSTNPTGVGCISWSNWLSNDDFFLGDSRVHEFLHGGVLEIPVGRYEQRLIGVVSGIYKL